MPKINLTAKGRDQELILAYLQENASDTLADKINNGVTVEKDGKQLVNRKDLDGFMKFACDEARKLAEKGSSSACVEDSVVYGRAIHYFEENSIHGKLFNPDGTEYKPSVLVKKTTASKPVTKQTPPPKPKSQFSFFDMLNEKKDERPEDCKALDNTDKDPSVEQIADALQQAVEQQHTEKAMSLPQSKPKSELYEKYCKYVSRYPDSVIAMRVGDFYEVFGKRATELADELNLTLTSRDLGLEQRIPTIGFPCHAAETYFNKLRQNYSVAVVEETEVKELEKLDLEDIANNDDELSLDEMRLFDGDISEPKEVFATTSSDLPKKADVPFDSDSPYDEAALTKVVKLLGDSFILR